MKNSNKSNEDTPKVIVQLKDVSKSFGKNNIIKGINLDIYEGEFLTLFGPSGCGKTTILRLISGLEKITKGNVHIEGKDATHIDAIKREVNTTIGAQNMPRSELYKIMSDGIYVKNLDEYISLYDKIWAEIK